MSFAPVAVVGQSCLLPGANDPGQLWQAVAAGRNLLRAAPEGRWRIARARILAEFVGKQRDCALTDRGGYVDGFDALFDPHGFERPADDIAGLDPLFQWVLHTAREALRQARGDTRRARAGLILGNLSFPSSALSRWSEAVWLGERARNTRPDPRNRFMSGLPAHFAAEALGLGGGAFALDAACASSLYALKLACDRLHDGSADLMLAGAVNRADDLFIHVGFTALQALSPSGRSRPFHREADGLVPAEGAAFVALKRLDDAIANGDTILGVIRGIGLSNDGRGSGLLAPSEEGQRRAMTLAYEASGLRPSDISLLECHATGTTVGDATEIRSTSAIFGGCHDVPVGSLKSNLGHLITVAGMAGLIKLLGALRHGVRPATLHADAPIPDLAGSPFRLLTSVEPWEAPGPRRAALSAFGFGGNNAHVIVEEWTGRAKSQIATPVAAPRDPVAIVGLGITAADAHDVGAFSSALFGGGSQIRRRADGRESGFTDSVELDAAFVRFPPRDLEAALPQQLLLLRAAREAVAHAGRLPRERTAVLVGMQCDTEVARYGARWRAAEWADAMAPNDVEWLQSARDAFTAALGSAGVLGTMPNICANRLNSQLDAAGPSLTVSAEEASGVVALRLAARALRAREIDAAVVGAVDVCSAAAHEQAADAVLPENRRTSGDAGVVLVVKRLSDAERDGNEVFGALDDNAGLESGVDPAVLFGHAHAASGLLRVAAAALALRHRAETRARQPAEPILPGVGRDAASVSIDALGGQRVSVGLRRHGATRPLLLEPVPRLSVFAAGDRAGVVEALRQGRRGYDGRARLVLVASSEAELAERVARATALLGQDATRAINEEGIAFRESPAGGELAFVFGAPAGGYRGMGRELALAFPSLVDKLGERWTSVGRTAGWIFDGTSRDPRPAEKLWGSSFLCQLHAELSRGPLGLRPQAAIGFCSGETNSLYALGAWNDLDAMVEEIEAAQIYERELAGSFDAVKRFRGLSKSASVRWASHRVLASLDALRSALASEPLAHLAIVNAPGDAVITGDADACDRVVATIGKDRARPLGYDMAVHCPELGAFKDEWRRIHRRATSPVPGVRFYTHATCDSYEPSEDSVADALLGQALATVDFPRLVEQAWRDGVRVFVEHGPQGGCARWTSRILGERDHVAVSLDAMGVSSIRQAANAVAQLVAAGVNVDVLAFQAALEAARPASRAPVSQRPLRFPVVRLAPRLPEPRAEVMQPAPALPSANARPEPQPPAAVSSGTSLLDRIVTEQRRVAAVHRDFLARQAAAHSRFLALANPRPSAGTAVLELPTPVTTMPSLAPAPAKRAFSRADLEMHASGRISSVFGDAFQQQDGHARQVRMPEPPLLLADRVTDIEGVAGAMGLGTVWTETDVREEAWYLHAGRMPAGVMIESGQADLFLISWLGVDWLNRGERVYRLLGCELTYGKALPLPGDTLRYEIHVDGHASQDAVRLFFFHYDCRIGDEVRLLVREGQAGFFTDAELSASGGVLWDAESNPPPPARVDPASVRDIRATFDADAVRAFSEGRVADCFGPAYSAADSHVETPRIAGGRMLLMGEVAALQPSGGPWGRGYLRAVRRLSSDDWFYAGHFKNDPCMPGTLMFEGCLQTMAFYLTALGYTLDHDGSRFEPVPDVAYKLRCRGQATPVSRELVYEVFVSQVHAGPEPTLYADLLCSVDGVKAFHCKSMGLRLVRDTPMARRPERRTGPEPSSLAVRTAGLKLDYDAMLACAWGPPPLALGPSYKPFDGDRRMPRLPGPPYHFLSRITKLDGEIGSLRAGAMIVAEYDVPQDAWYFAENGNPTMPFCVLLEAALQPCGWLALGTGIPLETETPLHFRNLDGTGTARREITKDVGTLRTEVRLLDISRSAGMSLVSFDVRTLAGHDLVFDMKTGFGFFPAEALANQVGLPTTEAERSSSSLPSERDLSLDALRARSAAALPGPKLLMLDRITGCWPGAGGAGLGRYRAEKDVRAGEWFFKAHFYQDPVQPGSLGLQALLQLLQLALIDRGLADGRPRPRFEGLALGRPLTWKYRGQVVPRNQRVTVEIELTSVDANDRAAVADGWLAVDGVRIYSATDLSARLV